MDDNVRRIDCLDAIVEIKFTFMGDIEAEINNKPFAVYQSSYIERSK